MAVVAVRRPRDFPEMGRLPNFKPCGSPQPARRPRQVAPAGWTMCECEADKDWILCDRVDAMAAEMAECIQRHLSNEKNCDAEMDQSTKEATMRFAEIQLAEQSKEADDCEEEQTEPKDTNLNHEAVTRKDAAKRDMTRAARKAAWRAMQKEEQREEKEGDEHCKARGKPRRSRRE